VNGQFGVVLRYFRTVTGPEGGAPPTDRELLSLFVARRDEAAFTALVERHGPMVFGVCRRFLRQTQDVDDVFQATFLVLLRRAYSISRTDSIGSWLYGVARRVAVRARANARKRQDRERRGTARLLATGDTAAETRDLGHLLDEELGRLPEKYRAPLVLHYLCGRTKAETARDLGWTEGTVSGRLARGRELLRSRLTRRSVALTTLLAACGLAPEAAPAAVPRGLRDATPRGLARLAADEGPAARLAQGMLRSLVVARLRAVVGLVLALGALAGSLVLIAPQGSAERGSADPSPEVSSPDSGAAVLKAAAGTDQFGDPLPAGAVTRLGTTRGRHAERLNKLALSPDGKLLATRASDDRVRLWEPATGRELHVLGGPLGSAGLWGFAFAADGKTLVTAGADGMLRFYDPATGRERYRVEGNPHGVCCVAFSDDGRLLAVGGEDNMVDIWDAAGEKRLRRLGQVGGRATPRQARMQPLRDAFFCPGDKVLAVSHQPSDGGGAFKFLRCLELLDVDTGRSLRKIGVPMQPTQAETAFSADGQAVLWISNRGKISLRAVDSGQAIREFDDGTRAVGLALSPDGRVLGVTSGPGVLPRPSLRLWDASTGAKGRWLDDSGVWLSLAFSRDGKTLAAGGVDGTFQLWDTATGEKLVKPPPGHEGSVLAVASSPDGRTLATCCEGGAIHLWQASTGREIRRRQTPAALCNDGVLGPTSLTYSPDGKTLAVAGWDRTVRLWDATTGEEVVRFSGPQPPGSLCWRSNVRFSPDGKLLATRDLDGAIRLWTRAGREERTLQRPAPGPWSYAAERALAFSPDGRLLAGSQGPVVRAWEVATGTEVRGFPGDEQEVKALAFSGSVTALAFSADGKSLASARNAVISLWEVATGRERRLLIGEGGPAFRRVADGSRSGCLPTDFTALDFTPDGQTLFAGRGDGGVYVWDLSADRPASKVFGHKEAITGLIVCGDGRTVATASVDRTVLVWDIAALKNAPDDPDH
jgi:RNA polymerase sigma factor (sigma-70 family)